MPVESISGNSFVLHPSFVAFLHPPEYIVTPRASKISKLLKQNSFCKSNFMEVTYNLSYEMKLGFIPTVPPAFFAQAFSPDLQVICGPS